MKLAGFLLLVAGWVIAISAVTLLKTFPANITFLLAGMAIQIVGFVFVAREHIPKGRSNGEA